MFDWYSLFNTVFFSILMTFGWTLMFNMPKKYIIQCLMITAMGCGLRNSLLQYQLDLVTATFFASIVCGFLGVFVSKRWLVPPKTMIVPSVICMMPGVTAYKAMISMIQLGYIGYSDALFTQMMQYFFNAMFVMMALVFGLSLPATLFYRRQPIV